MADKISQIAIVRGMTEKWFMNHFKDMEVYFAGKTGTPIKNSDYIGFYLESPVSAITHIGIVDRIDRQDEGATFHLKAIINLDEPIKVESHGIRKQEYWSLEDLGIRKLALVYNDFVKVGGSN